MGNIRTGALVGQNGAAGGGGGPLGGGGALVAVGHRHPVLPLGGAEMGGGHGGHPAGKSAVDGHGRQRQGLPHGGAGAVETVKGDVEFPQTEGGADALVQQVSGENIVQIGGGQACLFQRTAQNPLLHGGLRLLPGLFPKEGVLFQFVKIGGQGPLTFHFTADGSEGQHRRRGCKDDGLGAKALMVHGISTSSVKDFP